MPVEYRFVCKLAHGLHGRPASILSSKAQEFNADIRLTCESATSAAPVDVTSVLSVIGLDVQMDERCVLTADGPQAEAAMDALRYVIEHQLHQAEEAAEQAADTSAAASTRLPITLRRLGVEYAGGLGVCGGAGLGVAVLVGGLALPPEAASARAGDADAELADATRAIDALRAELHDRSHAAKGPVERALLAAHEQITGDPMLRQIVEREIAGGATAPQAVVTAADELASGLRAATTAYVRERALDVQDIAMQLIERLLPDTGGTTQVELTHESVVFAEALTANQLLKMDRAKLKGLVLGAVGQTSHTVILARNFGIPCIIDVAGVLALASGGDASVVDGDGGFVITPVSAEVSTFYERERAARERRLARLAPLVAKPAITPCGHRLEVATNAADAREIGAAVAMGAEGVGLFRTEFLFLDRDAAPDEAEQCNVYASAVKAAEGRPVIFRTFDIGGDKPAPYLNIPAEENPFLGFRGLRLYPAHLSLMKTQLRALLRASAGAPDGSVKIMAPMVAAPSEAAWFREQVHAVRDELRAEGASVASNVPVGMMIEVPSVALALDLFAEHVDFFSIGTNDLCQYWMAADRGNSNVASLCDPHHPSFIRLLRAIAAEANELGKWVGVCGEMGGRPRDLPLMIGFGLDEISGSARQIATLKLAVGEADRQRCRELVDRACACASPAEVETLLDEFNWRAASAGERAIIEADCMRIGADATTKEEAIRQAVEVLWIAGRTDAPRDVEEAVWAREETYSTGLGHGFAVPHCKSDAVSTPTLTVLKLNAPVEWGSMDDKPVSTVLMLTVPESESQGGGAAAHMKVFATLARQLMHEEFREALTVLTEPDEIKRFLDSMLQPG